MAFVAPNRPVTARPTRLSPQVEGSEGVEMGAPVMAVLAGLILSHLDETEGFDLLLENLFGS